ncbi:MAG: hypothetical protein ACN6O6_17850 [Pseudomonas sp.]|uniref:hypothetical protein n=1 Tax=Pseudomonas sp. TaxID=306 RepID=UPI003D118EAA
MKIEKRGKGGLWIREIATGVSFYRVNYGEKKERVITVQYDEVMKRQHEIRKLFTTQEATSKLLKYFATFETRHKNREVVKKEYLSRKQIIDFMSATPEALAHMIESDPRCEKPENRQLAYEMWKDWTPIRQMLSNASGWNIKEADSKKALGWGSVGKKEEIQDGTET